MSTTDERFRRILIRDYLEIEKCIEFKADKSIMILAGSIVESLLVEYFTSNLPAGKSERDILTMDLGPLIDLGYSQGLISDRSKETLATVIRHFRNLIHPGREVRKNEKFDNDTAIVAYRLVKIITNEIRETYLRTSGHKATDIITKLENDSLSHSIFDKLIEKLPKSERTKLYEILINYDFKTNGQFQPTFLNKPKLYLSKLKPFITRNEIEKQLSSLVKCVETGERWEVIIYYELLNEDVHYLDDDKLELIMVYLLSALKDEAESNKTSNFVCHVDAGLFSTFGGH